MSKGIKLVYNKFDNDIGFTYDEYKNNKCNTEEILELLHNIVNKKGVNKARVFNIYTWGIKKSTGEKCDIKFDLTYFQSKLSDDIDVRQLNGLSPEIIESIIIHPKFLEIMEKIIDTIEEKKPKKVGIFCNHGKHRSVCFAELIKKYVYNNVKVKHLCKIR